MASFKGTCVYCRYYKSLFYALASRNTQHCSRCHELGLHKTEAPRMETRDEYFARLGRQIEAARGVATYSEAELGPRSETIAAIYSKQKNVEPRRPPLRVVPPLKREDIKALGKLPGTEALDELRQANRKLMDQRRANYTQRQSQTQLK